MRLLGVVSLVQLVLGVLGLRKALDERLVPDLPGFAPRRRRDIADRHWAEGTALSAPSFMLVLQAVATLFALFGSRSRLAPARVLGVLGAIMSIGYPIERIWRESLVKPDRDLLPLTLGGFLLALKMAILGFAVRRPERP
ncbi:hypothetical protein [Microbacterium hominis]|uniref:DUF4345 domain-containing protein n=1 Tax=Microbacterium hominis TaxID=162426 RepID=A0A7D4Q6C8_9MICO|nr:hypothetical protein [Microbacterium hominis]QKJ18079.1 hypothetical protein HQM25_00725 [Microbacterium hominis]